MCFLAVEIISFCAINKGKDHKGYEFGTKASIATTKESGIIVGAVAHKEIFMILKQYQLF